MQAIYTGKSCRRMIMPIVLAVMVSGCASSLSRDECNAVDWRTIGYEDGVNGRPEARISEHRKACARHGVALELDAYRDGRAEGILGYCQPGNGYRQGRTGKQYAGVCPRELEPDFLDAYSHGRELYDLRANVQRIERKLRKKHARLDAIEVAMRDTGIELVTHGATLEQRVILLDEIRKLEEERAATRAQIPVLETELENEKQRLATISSGHE
ncbi:MAG: DUF2799 domain-containing protein [Gammaproteobacteria bacterium]